MAASSTVDSAVPRRRRPPLACEQCRRRKLRCDRNLPCAPCSRAREVLTCSYVPNRSTREIASSASTREKTPSSVARHVHTRKRSFASAISSTNAGDFGESHSAEVSLQTAQTVQLIEHLQQRIRQLERAVSSSGAGDQSPVRLGAPRTTAPTAQTTIHPPGSVGQGSCLQAASRPVHGNSSITSPVPRLRVSPQKTRLFGANHWVNATSQFPVIGDFTAGDVELSITKNNVAELGACIKNSHSIRQSWKMQLLNESPLPTLDLPATFPQKEVCDQLLACYLRTFEPIFRIIHIPTFQKEYEQFWTDPETAPPRFLMKLSLVFAIGTLFYKDEKTAKHLEKLARQWVYAAQWWLIGPSEPTTYNLDGIQVCCLLNLARHAGCWSSPLWISPDALLRMAMMVGLHRNTNLFPNLSPFQVEMRNRLWITVVELYIQSVMDSGVPCLFTLEDVDSVPPSNVDDHDISSEHETPVQSKTEQTFTDSSIQLLLARSIRLRLKVLRLINKPVRDDLTYENALSLGKELHAACREISTFFHDHNRSARDSHSSQATNFHHHFLDMILRRYILFLHRPFMIEARKEPRYYLSRKICVETCMVISSYTDRLDMATESQKDLSHLTLCGNASFKGALCMDVITVLGLEITMQIEEENSIGVSKTPRPGGTGDPVDEMSKANRAPLIKCMKHIHSQLEQNLEFGMPSLKRYNYLTGVLALIRAMESGLPVKQTIYEDIKDSLKRCFTLLQKPKDNEEEPFITTNSISNDIGDLASMLPIEDWNLTPVMDFSDYFGFPGFSEQPSSLAW